MTNALRQTVIVQPGGLIEIRSPELPVGASAEVIVLVDAPLSKTPPVMPSPLARWIGAARGGFATPAEADAFLNRERDTWVA
ncbi:MAG: hypothetical protein ACRDH2_11170 [Anaerolineales bacterium]